MNTKTLIVICTNRGIQPKTLQCLMNLKGDFDTLVATEGYTIAENRNWSAVQAINGKYDWMLFIDDDMTFEPDMLEKLKKNNRDICGVPYHTRGGTEGMKTFKDVHEKNLKSDKLFEAGGVGTGIMLIKTEIFLKIPRPWFDFKWHENGCCKMGEDWFFCENARNSGFKVWCEPAVAVGHLGDIEY